MPSKSFSKRLNNEDDFSDFDQDEQNVCDQNQMEFVSGLELDENPLKALIEREPSKLKHHSNSMPFSIDANNEVSDFLIPINSKSEPNAFPTTENATQRKSIFGLHNLEDINEENLSLAVFGQVLSSPTNNTNGKSLKEDYEQ